MKRLCLVLLLAIPAAALAEESADYEVHEWGYVCINVPSGANLKEAFLKELPGNIRQVAVPAAGDRVRFVPLGSEAMPQPVTPGSSSGRGGTPQTPASIPTPNTPEATEPVAGTPWEFFLPIDPYIWFHAKQPMQAKLTVKLGINKPLCWWPQGIDEGNSIVWKKLWIDPSPPAEKRTASFGKESEVSEQMRKAREVKASYINTGNKVERFVMYECMGLNWSGLRVESEDLKLSVRNASDRQLKALFLMPEGLGKNQAYYTECVEPWTNRADAGGEGRYSSLVDIRVKLCQVLEDAGLNRDEAQCMIRAITGFEAFVNSPGVKAVFLLDQESVEEISRLELSPKPSAVKRVWLALVFDAASYQGLGPILKNARTYDRILETLHKSGGTPSEIAGAIRRLDALRSR